MNNKWFKLAIVSFVGIIVSLVGLYFVQLSGGQGNQIGANHQMGTAQVSGQGPINQSMSGYNMTGQNQQMQGGYQAQYPGPGYGPGFAWGYYNQNNNGQWPGELNMMRQQVEQMRYQLNYMMNNMNNINGINNMNNMNNLNNLNNMNAGGITGTNNNMGSMPMM